MKWKRFLKIRKTERNNAARQTDEVSGQVQAVAEAGDGGFRYTAAFRQIGDGKILRIVCVGENKIGQFLSGTGEGMVLFCNLL